MAVSNTLTGLIPVLYEAMDVVSREQVGFIPAVAKNSSAERAAVGETITYPVVPQGTLIDIAPGTTPNFSGGQTIAPASMTISKSKAYEVLWGGEEQKGASNSGQYGEILKNQFAQAFRTIANAVEADLAVAALIASSRAYGTAGTTPFANAGDMSDFAQTRKILIDNGAPLGDLHMVLNTTAAANIRGKQSTLFKVNEANSDALLRQGSINALPIEGFIMHESGQAGAMSQVKGTGASYTTDASGYAIGSTTINLIAGSGTVKAGDVLAFAGDPNKYIVASGISAPGVVTLAAPGLQQAIPAAATNATVGNSYTGCFAFDRSAIQLVTRAPAMPLDQNGNPMDSAEDVTEVVDPVSGLVYQVAMYRLYRSIKFEIGLAWGCKGVKSNHIATLLG